MGGEFVAEKCNWREEAAFVKKSCAVVLLLPRHPNGAPLAEEESSRACARV